MKFRNKLTDLRACRKATDWVGDRTLEEAWDECPYGEWMVWLSMRMAGQPGWVTEQAVVGVLCDIVAPTMASVSTGYTRLGGYLDVIRRWCAGEEPRDSMLPIYHAAAADARNGFGAAKIIALIAKCATSAPSHHAAACASDVYERARADADGYTAIIRCKLQPRKGCTSPAKVAHSE